ncbi:hypothetical protein ACE6ED_11730 [Paenibacillus sp. CN-4]|uniref:hypothetical protein n=1 Tax=Paenibacillus nanchangensis TaxID=3348343 RepID=UPI003978FD4D
MTAGIALGVREKEYIEPLLHYLHHSEYGERMRISAFSRVEAFVEFMKQGDLPDAVVADPAFIEACLVEGGGLPVPWAVLGGGGGRVDGSGRRMSGGGVISKYQSLPSLLGDMLNLCGGGPAAAALGRTAVIGVVSAVGGCGKTTLSLNLARVLAEAGQSVFYLNLECVDSAGEYVRLAGNEGPGLDRLLYELKASGSGKDGVGEIGLDSYIRRYQTLGCDGFGPVGNLKEKLQMSKADTLALLDLLSSAGRYDVIVADTGALEEERMEAILSRSAVLLWLLRDERVSLAKTLAWLNRCGEPVPGIRTDLADRSLLCVNFCRDGALSAFGPEHPGPDFILPYIPAWEKQVREDVCLQAAAMREAVGRIAGTLFAGGSPAWSAGT